MTVQEPLIEHDAFHEGRHLEQAPGHDGLDAGDTERNGKPAAGVEGVQRLKGLFLEVAGARLTLTAAARLSGLDHPVCEVVLGALEDARFLRLELNERTGAASMFVAYKRLRRPT